jgi:hypothetical protein
LLVIATSFLIMPKPELRGDLEEVQIDSCRRPVESIDEANAFWDNQLAARPDAARPGWKEDSREMLQNDDGVVLRVDVVRAKTLRAERKPWSSGHILASEWQPVSSQKSYYARYGGIMLGLRGRVTRSFVSGSALLWRSHQFGVAAAESSALPRSSDARNSAGLVSGLCQGLSPHPRKCLPGFREDIGATSTELN